MASASPAPERCVEVIAVAPDGALVSYASGYRIADDLVLTGAHACPEGAQMRVRIGGRHLAPADLDWRGDSVDLALLRCRDSMLAAVPPDRIGLLPAGSGQVPFRMVGYPRLATRGGLGDELRDTWQVDGTLQLGSGRKSGLLGLSVDSARPPDGVHQQNPWAGMSGAAVFAQPGGELLGVVHAWKLAAGAGSLDMQPLATVADKEFRRRLAAAGLLWQELESAAGGLIPPLLTHAEALARLTGFGTYLTGDQLGFVSPGGDHPSAPESLFAQLSRTDPEHVLLVGNAGDGKTRTCFEVAKIAAESGWRVFHVQPYEPLAKNDDLGKSIIAGKAPALIIIDTISECPGLDFRLESMQRLVDEAQLRKIKFALLATMRLSQLRRTSLDAAFKTSIKKLFSRVEMRHDRIHTTAVRNAILGRAAPRAIARYGQLAVAKACGTRPLFALLIAAGIEGELDAIRNPLEIPGAEHPGLLDWLARRLDEDQLAPEEPEKSHLFAAPVLTPQLLASAAVTAACPLPRDDLIAVAGIVLDRNGSDRAEAPRIVDLLRTVGWLEGEGKRLSAVHDLVSDVLLQRVLMPEDDMPVAEDVLASLLDAGMAGSRPFSRFSAALSRALRDMPAGQAELLQASCAAWLEEHAASLAEVLSRSPVYESGQAVAALVGAPPWTQAVIEKWDVLIDPWLRHHPRNREARHLLYLSLSRMPDHVAAPLVATAVRWLRAHGNDIAASYILQALSRWDLDQDQRAEARSHTLRWLHMHAQAMEARWLITTLLRLGQDRSADDLLVYQDAARRWLETHGHKVDAFLLIAHGLDSRQPDLARQASISGAQWLKRHAAVPDAARVLAPLLRRTTYFTPELRADALTWLDRHAMTTRGAEVIRALLGRDHVLDENTRSVVVRKAVDWLEAHAADGSARSRDLLNVMLRRADPDVAVPVIKLALVWTEPSHSARDTAAVLRRLLRRKDLPDDVRRTAAERTLEFVRNSPASLDLELSLLLLPLLSDRDPAVRAAALAESLGCLDRYGDQADAWPLLQALLQSSELDGRHSAEVTSRAFAWLDDYPKNRHGHRVLAALLARTDLSSAGRQHAVQAGLAWPVDPGWTDEIASLLIALLESGDLESADRAVVEERASHWRRKNRDSPSSARIAVALERSRQKAALASTANPKAPRRPRTRSESAASVEDDEDREHLSLRPRS